MTFSLYSLISCVYLKVDKQLEVKIDLEVDYTSCLLICMLVVSLQMQNRQQKNS